MRIYDLFLTNPNEYCKDKKKKVGFCVGSTIVHYLIINNTYASILKHTFITKKGVMKQNNIDTLHFIHHVLPF